MANGAGTPAATPNPFGPQQPATPMGGGASPLNTGGGMGGQNMTAGTLGGFGGNLGTAGTLGGQQQPYTPQMSMGMPQPYQTNTGGFPPGMFPSAPQQQQPQQQMQGLQPTQLGTKPEMPQYHPQMPPGMQPAGINPYQQQMQAQKMLDMQRAQPSVPSFADQQNLKLIAQQQQPMGLGQQFGMQQQPRNPTIPLPGQSGYDPRFMGTLGNQPSAPSFAQNYVQQQQPQPLGQQAAQRQSDMLQGIESLMQSGQTPTASNRPRRTSRLFGGR